MSATPPLIPITDFLDLLNRERDPTLDELIDQAWLEQLLAIAQRADEIDAERAREAA
jgi:hypothetical protein